MTTKDPVAWIAKQEDGGLLLWDASYKHIQEGYDLGFNKSKRIKYYPLFTHPAHDDTAQKDTTKVCPICGEGKATLMVLRTCDNCKSEYAGSAELLLAKTDDDTALLRMALEALKELWDNFGVVCPSANLIDQYEAAITALRERLGEKA